MFVAARIPRTLRRCVQPAVNRQPGYRWGDSLGRPRSAQKSEISIKLGRDSREVLHWTRGASIGQTYVSALIYERTHAIPTERGGAQAKGARKNTHMFRPRSRSWGPAAALLPAWHIHALPCESYTCPALRAMCNQRYTVNLITAGVTRWAGVLPLRNVKSQKS